MLQSILKKKTTKINTKLFGPNTRQAKSGVFSFSVVMCVCVGAGPPKKSCSEFAAETCPHFGIFEIQQHFLFCGGGGGGGGS